MGTAVMPQPTERDACPLSEAEGYKIGFQQLCRPVNPFPPEKGVSNHKGVFAEVGTALSEFVRYIRRTARRSGPFGERKNHQKEGSTVSEADFMPKPPSLLFFN